MNQTSFYQQLADVLGREDALERFSVETEVLQEFFQDRVPHAVKDVKQAIAVPPQAAPADSLKIEPHKETARAASVQTVPQVETLDFAALAECAKTCRACRLAEHRKHVVFGEGNEHARLMFIGEGPGADEDEQGRPFVGKAGQLLDKMIGAMTFSRADVYIGNVVKCRPPNNRAPMPDEMECCIGFLKRQIELIRPEVLVILGNVPLAALFGVNGITRYRGRFLDYNGIPAMPTFHPAYLLRQESAKREVWNDLKLVMARLGIAINR